MKPKERPLVTTVTQDMYDDIVKMKAVHEDVDERVRILLRQAIKEYKLKHSE